MVDAADAISHPQIEMPLFDTYMMVDWSGGNSRRADREDCIWVAHGPARADEPTTESPPSRTEAVNIIRSLLETVVGAGGRALVCADFAYGYPGGFASLLENTGKSSLPPWRVVWGYLSQHLQDDLDTKPGRKPTNRSNRFAVANAINAAASSDSSPGPFWCLSKAGEFACVPQAKPPQPFALADGRTIEPLRVTDSRARSDTPFRLFGAGSVGSQIITGIPRLESIRFAPTFARCSAIWPFETGWAPVTGAWLATDLRVLHAEIYPSVRLPLSDGIKDRGQVRAMWHWARDLDAKDRLASAFSLPPSITSGTSDEVAVRTEEGWILGCPPP